MDWAEAIWQDYFFPKKNLVPTAPEFSEDELEEQNIEMPLVEENSPTPLLVQTPNHTSPISTLQNQTISNPNPPPVHVLPVNITPVVVVNPQTDQKKQEIRLASYVDLAFTELFSGNDQETWRAIPSVVKNDVLRHVTTMPDNQGKAEDIARRIFKNREWEMLTEIQKYGNKIASSPKNLDPEFKRLGEEVLNFYYSTKLSGNFHVFLQNFRALPISKEPNFLKYVYEIAKASNVKIESWDHQWAEYHWQDTEYLLISLQALERCLHA